MSDIVKLGSSDDHLSSKKRTDRKSKASKRSINVEALVRSPNDYSIEVHETSEAAEKDLAHLSRKKAKFRISNLFLGENRA